MVKLAEIYLLFVIIFSATAHDSNDEGGHKGETIEIYYSEWKGQGEFSRIYNAQAVV